ncbi:MAG: hypothetical protein KIS81_12090 [Maricaulaceae bacterium]|nr:hypothetical protein [Maricaulaceae bacterium]
MLHMLITIIEWVVIAAMAFLGVSHAPAQTDPCDTPPAIYRISDEADLISTGYAPADCAAAQKPGAPNDSTVHYIRT